MIQQLFFFSYRVLSPQSSTFSATLILPIQAQWAQADEENSNNNGILLVADAVVLWLWFSDCWKAAS
jgi:hypothetical protein